MHVFFLLLFTAVIISNRGFSGLCMRYVRVCMCVSFMRVHMCAHVYVFNRGKSRRAGLCLDASLVFTFFPRMCLANSGNHRYLLLQRRGRDQGAQAHATAPKAERLTDYTGELHAGKSNVCVCVCV